MSRSSARLCECSLRALPGMPYVCETLRLALQVSVRTFLSSVPSIVFTLVLLLAQAFSGAATVISAAHRISM